MPFLITPTTELEAVNECLSNIGEAHVASISGDDLGVDAELALSFVRTNNRQLQSMGWHWNSEKDYPLAPQPSGDILLPQNTLSVDSMGESKDRDVAQRGSRLYDRDNRTYLFTDTIYVSLILGLPFEDIPETARRYVTLRSARMFQDRVEGVADSVDTDDERMAFATLHGDQLRNEDNNVLTGSYSVLSILRR